MSPRELASELAIALAGICNYYGAAKDEAETKRRQEAALRAIALAKHLGYLPGKVS